MAVEAPDTKGSWFGRNWVWFLAAAVIAAVLLSFTPAALYFWSYAGFEKLLHEDAGLDEAWSQVGAVLLAIGYAAAIPYAGHWFIFGRRRRKFEAIVATVFILAIMPALHAAFDTNFDQETGQAQKWYVWRDSKLIFSDSPGFDPVTRAKRKLVTPEIAQLWDRQQNRTAPHKLAGDLSDIDFFDPITGKPRVWYSREKNGDLLLYDGPGFSPLNGEELKPVTSEIVQALLKQMPTPGDLGKRANCPIFTPDAVRTCILTQAWSEPIGVDRLAYKDEYQFCVDVPDPKLIEWKRVGTNLMEYRSKNGLIQIRYRLVAICPSTL